MNFIIQLLIFSKTQITSKKLVQKIVIHFLSVIHFLACFYGNPSQGELKLKQQKTRVTLMSKLRVIEILGVWIDQKMLIVEFVLFDITWGYNSRQYLFDMLNIDQMRYYIRLLQESNKPQSRHLLVLQLDFSMRKQQPFLFLKRKIVFLDINHVQILQLMFILAYCLNGILHQHFTVNLVHYHYSWILHLVFLSSDMLA